jgi:hypothetical protein
MKEAQRFTKQISEAILLQLTDYEDEGNWTLYQLIRVTSENLNEMTMSYLILFPFYITIVKMQHYCI